MKFMEKVWDNLGLFEAHEQDEEEKAVQPERRNKRLRNQAVNSSSGDINNVISLPTANKAPLGSVPKQLKVMVVEPVSFDDVQHVADYLKAKKPVVINLENTDAEISRRMVDFVSGTTYALNGNIQKISNQIFLCAPQNVDVAYSSHREERQEKSMFLWDQP
jgi:cell division inhibitor SepF